jgi:NADH-quinone oxidoreductase subunit C
VGSAEIVRKVSVAYPDIQASLLKDTHIEFIVPKDKIRGMVTLIDETFPMVFPENLFGVDLGEDKYQVNYIFWSRDSKLLCQLRVNVEGAEPAMDSVCDIFPGLEWHERETHEMFGIMFDGHPDLRPLLLPDELVGKYPLRKSFQPDRSRLDEQTRTPAKKAETGGANE